MSRKRKQQGPQPAAVERPTGASSGEIGLLAVVLAYFAFKAFYFCFRIRENIFPDEITHFGISELFGRSLLPPGDSADSFALGLITHVPTLYYVLMGKLLHLNVFGLSELGFLRCCNVVLGILTVLVAWKLARLVIQSAIARIVFVVLLTNTLMFTFLVAAVNYDNLVNLLAVTALFLLVRFLQGNEPRFLIGFLATLSAGMLTKTAFLPYAFVLVAVLLFRRRKSLKSLAAETVSWLFPVSAWKAVAVALLLFLVAWNVKLYGGNWIRFNRLVPRAHQILTVEQAMQSRIYARDRTVGLYRRGEITLEQARQMASRITHPGDRQDTLSRLAVVHSEKSRPRARDDRLTYAFRWADMMLSRIYGVAAHRMMWRVGEELLPYRLFYLLALAFIVRGLRPEHMNGWAVYLVLIFAFYALVLMQLVNYKTYAVSGILGAALQGRYLFPVLVPFYALASHYLVDRPPGRWGWVVAALLSTVFVWNELPWFLENSSEEWFFGS